MEPDSFKHYGILGMKWGIRKQPDGSRARTGSAADNTSGYEPNNPGIGQGGEPAKPGGSRSSSGSPNPSTMSDDELRSRINRLNMEKQYRQLTASQKTQSGAKKAGSIMLKEGGKVVANAGKQVATQLVKQELEKAVGLR